MKELDPDNSGLRLRICQSYLENAISDKAHTALRDTLNLLEKNKDLVSARKIKDLVESYLPDEIDLKVDVGRILMLCNQPEETVALLAGETDKYPDQKEILPVLAQAYRQMADFTCERQVYELLLAGEPENIEFQEAFARACLDCGEDQAALDHLEKCKEAFLQNGLTPVLKDFYEQLQVMRGDDEIVRQTLHQIYENTGEGSKLFDLLSEEGQKVKRARLFRQMSKMLPVNGLEVNCWRSRKVGFLKRTPLSLKPSPLKIKSSIALLPLMTFYRSRNRTFSSVKMKRC